MPLWHAAPPRGATEAGALGAAVAERGAATGRVFHGSGCCATAIDDSASAAAPTTAIRIPDKTVAINVPSPRKFAAFSHIPESAGKEIRSALNWASTHDCPLAI
jgi:hypothetical protein